MESAKVVAGNDIIDIKLHLLDGELEEHPRYCGLETQEPTEECTDS